MSWLAGAILALVVVPAEAVDFDTDVMPVLTKAGCNAAACHGASAGRGGFRLSLFGGDPAFDYEQIVRQREGRRINLARPDASLLIVKASAQIEHGGGVRFDFDGSEARLLEQWIAAGAKRQALRQLVRLVCEPAESHVAVGQAQQLRVTAIFDDGSQRDVTPLALYGASDPEAIEMDDAGSVIVRRGGRHAVTIRFLSAVQSVQVTSPLSEREFTWETNARRTWIDDEVLELLAAVRVAPAPPAADAALLRRLSLQLTGRLPEPDAILHYVSDQTPDKYARLVDRLLASSEFTDYWTFRLSQMLRVPYASADKAAAAAFQHWLREQIAADRGWDQIAGELLLATGDPQKHGPANFYLVTGDARGQAEYFSETLLGIRLRCANCHNHPLDRWTQDDYHGLAAIFAPVERNGGVRFTHRGQIIHPVTGEPARPRIPGQRFLTSNGDGRVELAHWMTDDANPFFAAAFVNRLWQGLLGKGLIEPVDDLRATNPPTHPQLLQRLTADFVEHGYSLRHTLRVIAMSATYARSSSWSQGNSAAERLYARATALPLGAEELADALADVTGIDEHYGETPDGTRAIALASLEPSETLDVLGRCSRPENCSPGMASPRGLATTLHVMNGPLLNARIADERGRLHNLLRGGATTPVIIEEFYLGALSRPPTVAEVEFWLSRVPSSAAERTTVLEDFVWSLLNSNEFLTNH